MDCAPEMVRLTISDDDCGFSGADIASDNFGLKIMHERTEPIGAELVIETRPGEGTRIDVFWTANGGDS